MSINISDRFIPMDMGAMQSYLKAGRLSDFVWPCSQLDLSFIETELILGLVQRAEEMADRSIDAGAIQSKLHDIIMDHGRLTRVLVGLDKLKQIDFLPSYDPVASPLLHYIYSGLGDPAIIHSGWLEKVRKYSKKEKLVFAGLKKYRSLKMSFLSADNRSDFFQENVLLFELMEEKSGRKVNLHPRLFDWPGITSPVTNLSDEFLNGISDKWEEIAGNHIEKNTPYFFRAKKASLESVRHHLAMSFADAVSLQRGKIIKNPGAILFSGTPKYYGRLLSWFYKEVGKKVCRTGHGGERVFYEDQSWAINELPFCDEYYCHSGQESKNIQSRLDDGRIVRPSYKQGMLIGKGSGKHRKIFQHREQAASSDKKKIMYVASQYTGEFSDCFPAHRFSDSSYFEWQVWLLTLLREAGYKISLKVHPKGVSGFDQLLLPYVDETVGGYFDPSAYDAGCYLFDFAGTAFFDAIASSRGVVLLDRGERRFDANSFDDLAERCSIVRGKTDQFNRVRVKKESLLEAVEKAMSSNGCTQDFYNKYFCV